MIDKEMILQTLKEHLGENIDPMHLDAAAQALAEKIQHEWVEVPLNDNEMGYTISTELIDVCMIDRLLNQGYEIKVLRSKKPVREPGFLDRKYLEHLQKP